MLSLLYRTHRLLMLVIITKLQLRCLRAYPRSFSTGIHFYRSIPSRGMLCLLLGCFLCLVSHIPEESSQSLAY